MNNIKMCNSRRRINNACAIRRGRSPRNRAASVTASSARAPPPKYYTRSRPGQDFCEKVVARRRKSECPRVPTIPRKVLRPIIVMHLSSISYCQRLL